MNDNNFISPKDYAKAAIVAEEAGLEMLSRLDLLAIKPQTILDVGCGVGKLCERLKVYYPSATIIALDHSPLMLEEVKSNAKNISCALGKAEQLPFASQSIDLLFANLVIPWQQSPKLLWKEWLRVLREDGVLFMSALGPGTLVDWRDKLTLIPSLIDLHNIGDDLLSQGYKDPVIDINYYTLNYRQKNALTFDLRMSEMASLLEMEQLQLPEEGFWSLRYEVIFAHAFKGKNELEEGVSHVPISALIRRKASSKE